MDILKRWYPANTCNILLVGNVLLIVNLDDGSQSITPLRTITTSVEICFVVWWTPSQEEFRSSWYGRFCVISLWQAVFWWSWTLDLNWSPLYGPSSKPRQLISIDYSPKITKLFSWYVGGKPCYQSIMAQFFVHNTSTHYKRMWVFHTKSRGLWHMREVNFVVLVIAMYNLGCLLWHKLHYNGNLASLGNGI